MLLLFSTLQSFTSLYTVLLAMSWPDAPGTPPWADSIHPASKTSSCSPWGEGPGLAHRSGPAAPAAPTSRDWEPGWGKGSLRHPGRYICPPLSHTACKQTKKIWCVTCHPFPFLPPTSPITEMYFLPTTIHSACISTPDLKIHDWLTPSSMEEIKCLNFQMPLPFESTHKAIFCFPAVTALTTLMDLTAQTEMAFQTLPRKKIFWYFKLFYFSGNS